MSALPDRPPRPERSDSDGQHAGHRERCHRRRSRRTATHEAAALDGRGSLLGTESFETTFDVRRLRQAVDWLRDFGHVDVVDIKSTGVYAVGRVRCLREHDIRVFEVNQPTPPHSPPA